MIQDLNELNDVIHLVVNELVDQASQNTRTDTNSFTHRNVEHLITQDDFNLYFQLIAAELQKREEIHEVTVGDRRSKDRSLEVSYCHDHSQGQNRNIEDKIIPRSAVLTPSRLAEIGQAVIPYVLETSETAIDDLTEGLGLSMDELDQLGIYHYGKEPIPPQYFFQVTDVVEGHTRTFEDFDLALASYRSLGDSPMKHLCFVPKHDPQQGGTFLLQQRDGKDTLCITQQDLPTELYQGSNLEYALSCASSFVQNDPPILFFVNDAYKTHLYGVETFEEALDAYNRIGPIPDKSISFHARGEDGRDHSALILKYDLRSMNHKPLFPKKEELDNPHIALATAKAVLFCYPFDSEAWELRTRAEEVLGITDRIVDYSKDLLVGKWRVHIVPPGGRYGLHNDLVNESKPMAEFYDTTYADDTFGPQGQFVSRYDIDILLGQSRWGRDLTGQGLSLDASMPAWTVTAKEMAQVLSYLKDFQTHQGKHPSLACVIQGAADRQQKLSQTTKQHHHEGRSYQ